MVRVSCAVAQACGGCPRLTEPEEIVREQKRARVQSRLERAVAGPVRVSWSSALSPAAYRNRIRLRIDESGTVRFFNPHKAMSCAILEPGLRRAERELRRALAGCESALFSFGHLELRAPDAEGRPAAGFGPEVSGRRGVAQTTPDAGQLDAASQPGARARVQLKSRLEDAGFLVAFSGDPESSGRSAAQPCQRISVTPEVSIDVPVGAFMQVNHVINRALVAHVVEGIAGLQPSLVVDLFCGSGNFTLPLSAALPSAGLLCGRAGTTGTPPLPLPAAIYGVEANPAAVAAAQSAAQRQGLEVHCFVAEVGQWLATEGAQLFAATARLRSLGPRVLLSDAPRAGLRGAIEPLLAAGPEHWILCSCHAVGLERDLAAAVQGGYRVRGVVLFDMFAFTDHLEAVAWLEL